MKININYDLLDKIREAKTGFSLNRHVRHILPRTLLASTIFACLNLSSGDVAQRFVRGMLLYIVLYGITDGISTTLCKKTLKKAAINDLRILSLLLCDINISTSDELLLDSDNYETEYQIKFNESKIPYIKQDKYINVPVYDNGKIRAVSLVQEHIVGSKKYSLSYGSPKKVLKPAFNAI